MIKPDPADLFKAALQLQQLGRAQSAPVLMAEAIAEGVATPTFDDISRAEGGRDLARQLLELAPSAPAYWRCAAWTALARGPRQLPDPRAVAMLLNARQTAADPSGSDHGTDLCYVLSMSLPEESSGYAQRTQAVVPALAANGLNVHCVTMPGFPWHRGKAGPATPQEVGTVTYHRSGSAHHPVPSGITELLQAERALLEHLRGVRPRAVMAASDHANALPALLAARSLGVPFIYDVRGFWEYSRAAGNPSWQAGEEFRETVELESAIAGYADLVLTLSVSMQDELQRRGVAPDKIHLLPNCADAGRFAPRRRNLALSRRLNLPADVPVIGYVGSFNEYEGLDDLVRAGDLLARRGAKFRIVLVGSDHLPGTPLLAGLRRLVTEAGHGDRIILPGRVTADEVADWYSLIDIAPIPRKDLMVTRLVSPMKPLEALAMEKAVVVPDLPALTEIVGHDRTGIIFPAGSVQGLADALERLLVDPNLRARLGRDGRDWVLKHRDWTTAAQPATAAIRALITP